MNKILAQYISRYKLPGEAKVTITGRPIEVKVNGKTGLQVEYDYSITINGETQTGHGEDFVSYINLITMTSSRVDKIEEDSIEFDLDDPIEKKEWEFPLWLKGIAWAIGFVVGNVIYRAIVK